MTWHFVIPADFADEAAALPARMLSKDYPYWLGGRFNWVAQSYLVLRQYREGATVGTTPEPGRINLAHTMTWRALDARQGEFRFSMRADYPRLYDVDFEILQNPTVPLGVHQAYLPYWPVPGLIPRAPERRGVRTIAYAGRIGPLNLADELREANHSLGGLEFRIIPPQLWHDLSEIDVLLAVRSLDRATHDAKPPSKLFSAWRAGVPLIGGWDSAFSAIGRPGIDYIRVSSMSELRFALDQLVSDPSLYSAIAEAGRARADEVSHEAIAQVWLGCLDRKVAPLFDTWRESGGRGLRSSAARVIDRARETAADGTRRLRGAWKTA